jgi:hypothetical protein
MLVVPFPMTPGNSVDPAIMTGVRTAMGIFMFALCAIGVWWLVFFNRPKVKEQFAPIPLVGEAGSSKPTDLFLSGTPTATSDSAKRRPLSISILAWLMLAGCFFLPFSLWLGAPAMLFTRLVTGWPAVLFYLCFAAAQIYIGIGLLRLKPRARAAAIIYFVFFSVNAIVFDLAPGASTRWQALVDNQRSMFPWMRGFQDQSQFVLTSRPFLLFGAVTALIWMVIPVYFLVTRKVAFERAAARLESGTSTV